MRPLNKEILRLAIPSILANITVPVVGMVDIAVAGHLHGSELLTAAAFIGGISVGSMLFDRHRKINRYLGVFYIT